MHSRKFIPQKGIKVEEIAQNIEISLHLHTLDRVERFYFTPIPERFALEWGMNEADLTQEQKDD